MLPPPQAELAATTTRPHPDHRVSQSLCHSELLAANVQHLVSRELTRRYAKMLHVRASVLRQANPVLLRNDAARCSVIAGWDAAILHSVQDDTAALTVYSGWHDE